MMFLQREIEQIEEMLAKGYTFDGKKLLESLLSEYKVDLSVLIGE